MALVTITAVAQENVHVFLRDRKSASPLIGVTMMSLDGATKTTSDSNGRIILPISVIKNNERLQLSAVGYKTLFLSSGELQSGDVIMMEPQAKLLEEVVITNNNPLRKVYEIQMGSDVITAIEAKRLPAILGESDILKVLQLKPGIKTAGEGMAGFYVRGGQC